MDGVMAMDRGMGRIVNRVFDVVKVFIRVRGRVITGLWSWTGLYTELGLALGLAKGNGKV